MPSIETPSAPTVSLNVEYLHPVPIGGTYTVHSEIVRRGRAMAIVDARVVNEEGKVLARGTCFLSDSPSEVAPRRPFSAARAARRGAARSRSRRWRTPCCRPTPEATPRRARRFRQRCWPFPRSAWARPPTSRRREDHATQRIDAAFEVAALGEESHHHICLAAGLTFDGHPHRQSGHHAGGFSEERERRSLDDPQLLGQGRPAVPGHQPLTAS